MWQSLVIEENKTFTDTCLKEVNREVRFYLYTVGVNKIVVQGSNTNIGSGLIFSNSCL